MEKVNAKLDDWFGGLDGGYEIIQNWNGYDDYTYYGVIHYDNKIACVRCFEVAGNTEISVDKEWVIPNN